MPEEVYLVGGAGGTGAGLSAGVSTLGNTLGTTGVVGGQLVFAGGNNITVSESANAGSATVTIIGAAAGTGAGISGIVGSNATYTSGTVVFTGSNAITVRSTTGQAIVIDATTAAQTAESQTFGMSNLGNTAGTSGVASGAQVRYLFAGGNNVTLSQSLNGASGTVTISAFNQSAQTGISGLSATNTLYTSGTVVITGSNLITVRSSGLGQTIILDATTAAQSVQTQGFSNTLGISNLGNTAGTSGVVSGTGLQLFFAGGNNVTLSQSVNASSATITISAVNTVAQTAQTGISGIAGSAASTVTQGTVQFANSNGVSFGLNGSTMTASHNAITSQSIQTYNVVSASGNTSGTLTSFTTGTIVLAGGNNITLSQSSNSITISGANVGGAQTGISSLGNTETTYTSGAVQLLGSNIITVKSTTGQGFVFDATTSQSIQTWNVVSASGNTSGTLTSFSTGTMVFAGGNNITLSQSSNTITISAGVGGGGGVALSAGTQSVSTGTVKFADSNGISFGMSGSSQVTASYTVPIVTAGSDTLGISNLGNTAGTSGVVSGDSVRYLFAGGNNITLSQSINGVSGTVTISAFNQSAQTAISGISATNTLYTSGTVLFTGSNIITVKSSGAGQTIILDATTSQSVQTQGFSNTLGMSNLGNTAGTSGIVSGTGLQLFLAGGNNVTLSQSLNGSSATITVSGVNTVAQSVQTWNVVSASGNTAGTLTSFTSGTIVLAGGANVTLSQSSNTITIAGATVAGQPVNFSAGTTSNNLGSVVFGDSNGVSFGLSGSTITATVTGPGTISQWMPRGLGVSTFSQIGASSLVLFPAALEGNLSISRADLFGSVSVSTSSNSSHGGTLSLNLGIYTRNASTLSLASSGSVTYAWTVTGSTSSVSIAGNRGFSIPINAVMTPGDYFIGAFSRTASANANWYTISNFALMAYATDFDGPFFAATNATNQFVPGMGVYSTTTSGLPASIAFSQINATQASTLRPIMNFMNYTA